MARILIIDDEPQIRRFLRISLQSQQYEIIEAENGQQGINLAATEQPDLIVLDLGLPDMDGQMVLQEIRQFAQQPILVLSVRNQEHEKVMAFDHGGNDYVEKPFGIKEFLARVRNLLQCFANVSTPTVEHQQQGLYINFASRKVLVNDQPVHLSKKEFALLQTLLNHQGRLVTQQYLLKELWGEHHIHDTHYLRIFIARLRQKLQDNPIEPRFIETEPGIGYRFIGKDSDSELSANR
ncbi:response regulator [Zooshikella sp. RANM57]|uniref:response regulator n=1 Tax=Zooshikella sp. RANM57 TaxID=3425863 RepID=UPI003D701584